MTLEVRDRGSSSFNTSYFNYFMTSGVRDHGSSSLNISYFNYFMTSGVQDRNTSRFNASYFNYLPHSTAVAQEHGSNRFIHEKKWPGILKFAPKYAFKKSFGFHI